jgi:hypothetical protein
MVRMGNRAAVAFGAGVWMAAMTAVVAVGWELNGPLRAAARVAHGVSPLAVVVAVGGLLSLVSIALGALAMRAPRRVVVLNAVPTVRLAVAPVAVAPVAVTPVVRLRLIRGSQ